MRFPFLAAEYTNICAFATFSKSSAVELLTGQKFCGPAGGLRAPVRCAARAWRPCPPPSRRTPRLCGSRFPGLRLRGPPVLAGTARRRSVQDTATPVAFGLPAMNVYTFPHLANTPGGFGPAAVAVRRVTPSLRMQDVGPCAHGSGCKICIRLHAVPTGHARLIPFG